MFFPNSFSYGVLANIGSGQVPGQCSGTVFGKVPGPSGAGSGRVRGFREGCGAGSGQAGFQVPGRFKAIVSGTGFGEGCFGPGCGQGSKQISQVLIREVPGQVPGFRHKVWEGSG